MKHLEASPYGYATNRVVLSGWPSAPEHRHDIVSDATRAHETNEADLNRCNGRMRHAFVVRHVIERAHSPLWEGNESENWHSVY